MRVKYLQMMGIKLNNCHPLEVVGRGSEIQLQGGEKYNMIM